MRKELKHKIQELEGMINYADQLNPAISSKGVGWHIDHSLKVIIYTCEALKKSNPAKFKMEYNPIRARIFKTGSIPRGVAKAPKSLMAQGEIQIEELQNQFIEAGKQIDTIKNLHEDCHFDHPYFGKLNLGLAKQFFIIHTEHHLKIIRGIISK